jgi:hypothetical protein
LGYKAPGFTTSQFIASNSIAYSQLLMLLPLVYSRMVRHRNTLSDGQDQKENAENSLHTSSPDSRGNSDLQL